MAQKPLYHWVDSSITDPIFPHTAVQIGSDAHGHPVYVGKAPVKDIVAPTTVIPDHKKATVPNYQNESSVENYQLLCLNELKWVPDHDGRVLPGAVQAGYNKDGFPLYVGKVFHEGSWIVGAINPKQEVCYFPYNGKELSSKHYEALVADFFRD